MTNTCITTPQCQDELVGGQEGEPELEDFNTVLAEIPFELVGGAEGEPESDYYIDAQSLEMPLLKNGEITALNGSIMENATPAGPIDPDRKEEFLSFEGRRVVAGTPFDIERVVSIGNARCNEITGQMTVADAVEYVRSSESKKHLDAAVQFSGKVQGDLWRLIEDCQKRGKFDFARTTCLSGLRFDQKKALTQELTNLLKEMNGRGEQAIKEKLKAISWRHAKAMRLFAFMWTGKFGVRNNSGILAPSGLMCVDFDKLTVDIQALMEALRADPLVFWAARSPSGTGVKLVVRIPDGAALSEREYLACFETFERYIASKYPGVSVSVDKQAKAIAQLCFIMHDPDSFCKPDAYILQPDQDLVAAPAAQAIVKMNYKSVKPSVPARNADARGKRVGEGKGYPFDAYPPDKQWETVRAAVESIEGWLTTLPEGVGERNKVWTRIGYAFGAWLKQIDDESIRDEGRSWLMELAAKHYAGNEGCVERAMDGSNGTCGLGTLFKLAREKGNWTAPWDVERADRSPKQEKSIIEHMNDFQSQVPPMKCVHDRWYAGGDGLWKPVEQEIYQPTVLGVLPHHKKSSRLAKEVMATFQMQQQVPRESLKTAVIWEDETHQAVLINCRNGLLRVTAAGAVLMPHDPKAHWFTGQLAAAYDLSEECDVFERVLGAAQPNEQAKRMLSWWFGYVLYPALRFRLSLVNFGPSTTGKSTIWEYGIGATIGAGLKKNLSLSDICSTTGYSIPGLQHALLNVGGELDADELAQSSRFKLLVGGEPLEVRGIYGRPYTMEGYIAKLVFLTNHLPRFRSGTDAELRRLQFVCWDKVPAKPDPKLLDLVANEKDGVFTHWMVPALQKILAGVEPLPDEQMIRNEFALRNDPMKVFLDTYCVVEKDATIEKTRFRRAFSYFVDKEDLPLGLKEDSICGRLLIERTHGRVAVASSLSDFGRRFFEMI